MQGKPGECAESLNGDLHRKKNTLPALKVKTTTKEMLMDSRRKRPTHALNHNQWRTKFEVEVLTADNFALSLHAAPLSHQLLQHVHAWRCLGSRAPCYKIAQLFLVGLIF